MKDSFKKSLLKTKAEDKGSKLVAVRMPNDLVAELSALSSKTGKSVSRIVIEALRYALEVREKSP